MARREVILRDDLDGGKRLHEVELRTWKVTGPDGRSVTFESDSWFAARQNGRMEFMTEGVKVEEVEDAVLFTDGKGEPLVMTPATPEELRRSEMIMSVHGPLTEIQIEEVAAPTPSADVPAVAITALERLKNRAKGK